jgi:hypothetical protein
MFIGHFGTGFAAKKFNTKVSLGTYFFAAQFIDLLWPLFLLFGWEKVIIEPGNTAFTPLDFIYYPFSHSFFGVIIWGVLFGSIYYLIKKKLKGSIILGFLVLSHWILDLFVHKPDLPLFPWSDIKVGLGLWNSVPLTILIESIIFFIGVYLYTRTTKTGNKIGNYGFWGLVVFLLVIYITNIFGPSPPSEEPIAYIGFSQWILVAWAYWVDKYRVSG